MRQWFSGKPWRNGLLLVSLCLNAVLVGYLASLWLRPQQPLQEASVPRVIERVAARLPSADADILWRIYRSKQNEFAAARSDYVQALVRPIRLIGEEPLDAEALRKALVDSRDKRLRIGDLVIETFLEALSQMSTDGRRRLVGRIGLR